MRQTVSGPFSAHNLGIGVWHVTTAPGRPEIVLRGAGPEAAELLEDASIAAIGIEWRVDAVRLVVTTKDGVRYLKVASAIVHEPRARLYDELPLARFDSDAKRFWKRVFRLLRIPGGRFLIGLMARRKPGAKNESGPASQ